MTINEVKNMLFVEYFFPTDPKDCLPERVQDKAFKMFKEGRPLTMLFEMLPNEEMRNQAIKIAKTLEKLK